MKITINLLNHKTVIDIAATTVTVPDFMGNPKENLVVLADGYPLTKNFGEFIGAPRSAYIDENNCPWAKTLVDLGVAERTALDKKSGFCSYPLYIFTEEFVRETLENPDEYLEQFNFGGEEQW